MSETYKREIIFLIREKPPVSLCRLKIPKTNLWYVGPVKRRTSVMKKQKFLLESLPVTGPSKDKRQSHH